MADCAKLVREATGLSAREVARVLRELQQDVARRGLLSDPEAVAKIALERKAEWTRAKANRERAARIEAVKIVDALGDISKYKRVYDGAYAFMVGTNDKIQGARHSVEARSLALHSEVMEGLFRDLEADHPGIRKLFTSNDWNLKVAREMWGNGKESLTGNPDAFHASSIFDKYKEIVRKWANAEGADIDRIPGHVFAQTHDPLRISRGGFDKWSAEIIGRLDIAKTFGGSDPKEVLRSIFEKIEADRYNIFSHSRQDGSLAKRMAAKRFLIFKSADDWLAYNRQFGTGRDNVVESYLHGLLRRTKETALMQGMGPNPDDMLERLLMAAERTDPGPAKSKLTKAQAGRIKNQFAALAGYDRVASNPNVAAVGHAIRSWMNLTKLGTATLSSFMDLGTAGQMATYNGRNFLSAYHDMMTVPRRDPKVASFLDTFSDGVLANISSRLSAEDGVIGISSRLSNQFFKWSGLTLWTDSMKAGFAWAMARNLGDNIGKSFDALPEYLRRNLGRYGIDAVDWKTIQATAPETINGKRFLTPELVQEQDVSRKLRGWFMSEAEFAVPTPGAAERGRVLSGTQPGSLEGETLRYLSQFKMFTASMMMRIWPRVAEQGVPGAIQFAALSAIFGYASVSAKAMVQGQKPPDPTDPRTVMAALVTSGGLGVLGDLLLSDFNSTGRSLAEVVAGPAIGVAGDATRVWAAAWRGEDAAGRAMSTLIHNMPYNNVFYARAAINYLLVYQIQEMMNPGYLRRMEKRMKSETGVEWWMPPSKVIKRGGGFR